jgi:hypothetical protein
MIRQVTMLLSLLCAAHASLFAAESPVTAVGQTVTQGASIDGTRVPSGTTVLHDSVVSSGSGLVLLQLSTGQMLELAKSSGAGFQSVDEGVQVTVLAGTVSFLGREGETITAPPGSLLLFTDRQPGRSVEPVDLGIVAVLTRDAGEGDLELRVNDTARVHPRGQILIRSKDGESEEVHKVASTTGNTVKIRSGLQNRYPVRSLLIQSADGASLSGAGRGSNLLGSGRLLGIGAGAGLVSGVAVGGGNEDEGAKELSPVQPN